ncbi:MAG TPA: hypothetical protein VMF56_10270 [Acidobacteriaceae bacterium]|nr:hypothetical protein [Acidobacteriaceae bacterium]
MKTRFLFVILALSLGIAAAQQFSNTNDSVIKMVKAGMSDSIVISSINSQPAHFSLSANDLIALKQAGVSDAVMAAMIAKNAPAAPPTPNIGRSEYPTDIGVYYGSQGVYTNLQAEVVNTKTGGFMKSLATDGIVKGDINGHINGEHSPTSLTTPLDFLIVVRDGDAPAEYQLLHLHTKSKYREFRSVTGGAFHSSTGASCDLVDFQSVKVAPLTYKITLTAPLAPGEYGFFPRARSLRKISPPAE